jgi:hypothetical protein
MLASHLTDTTAVRGSVCRQEFFCRGRRPGYSRSRRRQLGRNERHYFGGSGAVGQRYLLRAHLTQSSRTQPWCECLSIRWSHDIDVCLRRMYSGTPTAFALTGLGVIGFMMNRRPSRIPAAHTFSRFPKYVTSSHGHFVLKLWVSGEFARILYRVQLVGAFIATERPECQIGSSAKGRAGRRSLATG